MKSLESKAFKVNLGIAKMPASEVITKNGLSKCKVYPCGICRLRVKSDSVLYVSGVW